MLLTALLASTAIDPSAQLCQVVDPSFMDWEMDFRLLHGPRPTI